LNSENETGLLVTIRHSKTDQEGEGATIAIARGDVARPANALRAWLDASGIEDGPIFRPIDKAGTVRARGLRIDPSPILSKPMPGIQGSTPARSRRTPAGRFPHVGGEQGRINLQDDGC
jgi:hypothetical protein